MKRILIDLDILTNAFWKGVNRDRAKAFLAKISGDDFEILTPSSLITTVFEWKDRNLARSILSFYSENSDILSQKTILNEFQKSGIDFKAVIGRLAEIYVKEEDAFLVLVAAVFNLSIYTFNKKHLAGKKQEINENLKTFGLNEVEINEPA